MLNIIRRFFAFLFPIFGTALTNIVLDESEKFIREQKIKRITDRRNKLYEQYGRYSDPRYGRISAERQREILENLQMSPAERAVRRMAQLAEEDRPTGDTRFHDVLMVAFDLQGRSAEDVHGWLMDQMPQGDFEYTGTKYGTVYLDSWWVANDERFDRSDCDSAIFVPFGRQGEAREFMGRNFPADPDEYF